MAEHTPYQRKIIERYYDQRGAIALARLQDIASDLLLADSDAKLRRLWDRADKAMRALGIPDSVREHILEQRKPEILTRNLREWLRTPGESRGGSAPPR